jgi:hypothetical protein
MNPDARKLIGPDKPIVECQQPQVPRMNRFARAALLVAPFISAFAIGFGISHALHSKQKPDGQPTAHQPAKNIPLDCGSQYAPSNPGQYYFDEHGRLQEGYVVVDGHGRVILCPPTWKRD